MNQRKKSMTVEYFLIFLIAIGMIASIHITNFKLSEVLATRDSLMIRELLDPSIGRILKEEFTKQKMRACTMIETYEPDLNLILRVCLDEEEMQDYKYMNIKDNPRLVRVFQNYKEGYTRFPVGNVEQDIYFQWSVKADGTKRMAIVYLERPTVKNLWILPFICYLELILIFILVARTLLLFGRDSINIYSHSTNSMRSRINN
jgi:hypothetical protein